MKFRFPSIKTIILLLSALLITIAIGTGLLTLMYTIPVDAINANVAESVYIFQHEGDHPSLNEHYVSNLDNFTDALMLKEAAYTGNESAFQKAMLCPRNVLANGSFESPTEEIVQFYSVPQNNQIKETYSTYWHGYLVSLKPLLLIFTYKQIRNINLFLQFLLLAFILVLLAIKNRRQLIPVYVITALMLRPIVTADSMQHSTIYYIVLVSSILLLLFNDKLKTNNSIWIFFLLIGASTSYLDYLTYPLLTFGIPAALFVYINKDDKYSDVKIVFNLLVCWGIGYVGMWASKWILASMFTNENVISSAIESIKIRSGNSCDGTTYTYFRTLLKNIYNFVYTPYTVIYLIVFAIEAEKFISLYKKHPPKESLSFVFISLLPLLWYAGTINHSYIHGGFYTYKEWAVTAFAMLTLVSDNEWHKDIYRHKQNQDKYIS